MSFCVKPTARSNPKIWPILQPLESLPSKQTTESQELFPNVFQEIHHYFILDTWSNYFLNFTTLLSFKFPIQTEYLALTLLLTLSEWAFREKFFCMFHLIVKFSWCQYSHMKYTSVSFSSWTEWERFCQSKAEFWLSLFLLQKTKLKEKWVIW